MPGRGLTSSLTTLVSCPIVVTEHLIFRFLQVRFYAKITPCVIFIRNILIVISIISTIQTKTYLNAKNHASQSLFSYILKLFFNGSAKQKYQAKQLRKLLSFVFKIELSNENCSNEIYNLYSGLQLVTQKSSW